VTGNTLDEVRHRALRDLDDGALNILFTVDLFNEGVDVPEIDTVLFLRPTESATVFLQQLGRGLRKADNKPCLTVLDFIGQQHRSFRFDQRFRGLIGGSRRDVVKQAETDFPFLPPGCYIHLDRVAKDIILDNLQQALGTKRAALVRELKSLGDIPLASFLSETGLDVTDVYRSGRSWTQLRREAGLLATGPDPDEAKLARALGRILHVDDPERLHQWSGFLQARTPPDAGTLTEHERRLLTMLHFDLWGAAERRSLEDALSQLWRNPTIRTELLELLDVLGRNATTLQLPMESPASSLLLHARYTRDEIMAGIGAASADRPKALREGAYYDKPSDTDVFFITLEKDESHYSPTTLYRDYAISPRLFHWESQSKTSEASETGHRFASGKARPLLFIRERLTAENGVALAYLCAGSARYVKHEGERPMAITWALEHELPADFFEVARVAAG